MTFINPQSIDSPSWQAFERLVYRFMLHDGFSAVRLVGQSGDGGADVTGTKAGKRWLFQVKRMRSPVPVSVLDRTVDALRKYRAQVPVVVALGGFTEDARRHQLVLQRERIPIQLWDRGALLTRGTALPTDALVERAPSFSTRAYQEDAIRAIVQRFEDRLVATGLVVLATGLGKTAVAAEAFRRLSRARAMRLLAIAHTNELVYQLERSFWPFLSADQRTAVWNGIEQPSPDVLGQATCVFACLPTVAGRVEQGHDIPPFDVCVIDEAHHAGAEQYRSIVGATRAGTSSGPFLLGLTATPWRPDGSDLFSMFGDPVITMDLVTGLKRGFLANIDYRMYTDNIDWSKLSSLGENHLSPRQVNRTLFIDQWDDAVVYELQKAWEEQSRPRALVFCGTIDHAIRMRDRINALGFCRAEAIFSQAAGQAAIPPWERNRILADFNDGFTGTVCAVDIFNEGLDVPDVNILVFQRVTHSRRIFIQQLGRGLRLAPDKDKVIVLDFVSDIRRFAAGITLKDELGETRDASKPVRVDLRSRVTFRRVNCDDFETESFLREWLGDVAAVEEAGEDASVLRFPPLHGSTRR